MLDKIFAKIERFLPEKWRWILSHDGFKRYFANTGWMFLGQFFSLVVAFFIGAWLARYLGPKDYGILNYALAFSGVFGFLANLGVDAVLNRELVNFPEKRSKLLGTAFRFKLIGGLVAFSAATVAAVSIEASPFIRLLVIIFSLTFIIQSINVISSFFQATVSAVNNVKVQIAVILISSILKIALILSGLGVLWVIVVYLFDFVWQGIGLMIVYRRSGEKINAWRYDKETARRLWHDSWLLMLTGAAVFIYVKIDQVLVEWLMGEQAVGIYSAAVKISEAWYFIPSIICASLFPAIINAKKTNAEVYKRRLDNLYALLIFLAVIISLAVTILSRPMIALFFGSEYLASIPVLRLYIWSSIGIFWGWAISQHLIAENSLKMIFFVNFISMLANIGLNLLLIPRFGLLGAAYATLISYFVAPLIILSRRQH